MELTRAYTDLGPNPRASLPDLRPWDREALIRPGRREATAGIRREWDTRRRQVPPRVSEQAWLKEYAKYIQKRKSYSTSAVEANHRKMHLEKAVLRDILRAEVFKRNITERIPYATNMRAVTAPLLQPVTSLTCSPVTLFQQSSGNIKHRMEKRKRPMHFINKEWASEKVSWVRFHTNVSDYHKCSWIE